MGKHTPGPWEAIEKDEVIYIVPANRVKHFDTWTIAQVRYQKEDSENATLIAAAPELLEACKKSIQYTEQLCAMLNSYALQLGIMPKDKLKVRAEDFREHLDQAIAKSEGK